MVHNIKLFTLLLIINSVFTHLRFISLGDWGKGGRTGDIRRLFTSSSYQTDDEASMQPFDNKNGQKISYTYQAAIAETMDRWAEASVPSPSFILTLGDNFYTAGVSSVNDTLWGTLWEEVYLQNNSNLNIPWYPVFGNHDYGFGQRGIRAQIQRTFHHSSAHDGLWQFPSTNYTKTFPIPGGGSVKIVFIDTTTLAPSENSCCNIKGGVTEQIQQLKIQNQLQFITQMLEETTATDMVDPPTWLLVAGHYPVYSRGAHGDTEELVKYLQPVLHKYKVDAYISGHDHISEHLRYNGTEYFVSGAGSMTDSLGNQESTADLLWYGVGYSAFSYFDATNSSLQITYMDAKGDIRYQYSINKDGTQLDTTLPIYSHTSQPTQDSSRNNHPNNPIQNPYFNNIWRLFQSSEVMFSVLGGFALVAILLMGVWLHRHSHRVLRSVSKTHDLIPTSSSHIIITKNAEGPEAWLENSIHHRSSHRRTLSTGRERAGSSSMLPSALSSHSIEDPDDSTTISDITKYSSRSEEDIEARGARGNNRDGTHNDGYSSHSITSSLSTASSIISGIFRGRNSNPSVISPAISPASPPPPVVAVTDVTVAGGLDPPSLSSSSSSSTTSSSSSVTTVSLPQRSSPPCEHTDIL